MCAVPEIYGDADEDGGVLPLGVQAGVEPVHAEVHDLQIYINVRKDTRTEGLEKDRRRKEGQEKDRRRTRVGQKKDRTRTVKDLLTSSVLSDSWNA